MEDDKLITYQGYQDVKFTTDDGGGKIVAKNVPDGDFALAEPIYTYLPIQINANIPYYIELFTGFHMHPCSFTKLLTISQGSRVALEPNDYREIVVNTLGGIHSDHRREELFAQILIQTLKFEVELRDEDEPYSTIFMPCAPSSTAGQGEGTKSGWSNKNDFNCLMYSRELLSYALEYDYELAGHFTKYVNWIVDHVERKTASMKEDLRLQAYDYHFARDDKAEGGGQNLAIWKLEVEDRITRIVELIEDFKEN
jgi:hypothetical protein